MTVGGEPVKVTNGSYQLPMQLAEPSETITITGPGEWLHADHRQHDRSIQWRDRLEIAAYQSMSNPSTGQVAEASGDRRAPAPIHGRHAPKSFGSTIHTSTPAVSRSSTSSSALVEERLVIEQGVVLEAIVAQVVTQSAAYTQSSSHHRSSSHKAGGTHNWSSHHQFSSQGGRYANGRATTVQLAEGGQAPATSRTARASRRVPEQRSTLTVRDIKRLWIERLREAGTGGSYRTYCRCTYAHLAKVGRALALASGSTS